MTNTPDDLRIAIYVTEGAIIVAESDITVESVPGTRIFLVGPIQQETTELLATTSNQQLKKTFRLQDRSARALRLFLGIGNKGGRGGRRPGAGRKAQQGKE